MTDAPPTPETDSPDVHLSHLANLHRMSRTAGLGSSNYTAVNIAAVIAILVGAASGLALMTPIFLLLPAAGLVVALLAIIQIRRSGGTQTGMGLAVLGLVLCLGFSSATGYQLFKQQTLRSHDVAELNDLLHRFGQSLADKKYSEAYGLTDARFREQVPQAKFEAFFTEMSASPTVGPVVAVRSNGIFQIDADPETDLRQAVGIGLMDTQKLPPGAVRGSFRYRHTDNGWLILSLPEWFGPGMAPANAPAQQPDPSNPPPNDIIPPSGPQGPPVPH